VTHSVGRIALLLVLVTVLCTSLVPAAVTDLTVGNYRLVSSKRVTRTAFEYTYRANVTNAGAVDVLNVTASLTSRAASTVVIEGNLTFGDVPAGHTVTSSDTFTIRQDRRVAFKPADLVWTVTGQERPVTLPVPNVVGLPQQQAIDTLTGASLAVGMGTMEHSETVPVGSVISQQPAAGTPVPPGSAVDLVVSLGPAPVPVPDVVGQERAAAKAALMTAGLAEGTVTTAHSSTVPAGHVISQSPVAGTPVPPGTAVDLVVSLGPVLVPVPDVVGQEQTEAVSTLVAAGLAVGNITMAHSPTVPAGHVISQLPVAGASVAIGSLVDLVVSLGMTDTTPPVVTITSPAAGSVVFQNRPPLDVSYSDADGVNTASLSLTANGVALQVDCQLSDTGGRCTPTAALPEGLVMVVATVQDLAGNPASTQTEFTVDSVPLAMTILAPADGLITKDAEIQVTGTVEVGVIAAEVNGVAASVTGTVFSATVPLRAGVNMLVAVGTKANGKTGTASVEVTRDTVAPIVRITSPRDGFVAVNSAITVTGQVNDTVTGGTNARVVVNGVEATVMNGSFMAMELPLVRGTNTIEAVATDAVGNEGRHAITVTFEMPVGARIALLSGNGQAGTVNQSLAMPLVAVVRDELGNPVAGRLVRFEVTRNSGLSGYTTLILPSVAYMSPLMAVGGQLSCSRSGIRLGRVIIACVRQRWELPAKWSSAPRHSRQQRTKFSQPMVITSAAPLVNRSPRLSKLWW